MSPRARSRRSSAFRPDLFDRWVIVSNAIGHGPNAERATAGRGDVTWVHRDAFVDSTIDWTGALEAVSGKAKPKPKLKPPREPDQTTAIADTLAALKKHERVQLIMACGTGKTLVTRWITEAREDRLVLVLVPTLLLLKQFRTQWREQARYDFIDIGVCSDKPTRWARRRTCGPIHPDELSVRVTTDPDRHRHVPQGRRTPRHLRHLRLLGRASRRHRKTPIGARLRPRRGR